MPFPRLTERTLTIAINEAVSGSVDTRQEPIVGVRMPAAWTDAHLRVEESPDGVTFYPIYSRDYDIVKASVPAGGAYPGAHTIYFSPIEITLGRYLRLRSVHATTGADVNQAASRSLTLITKDA